MKAKIQHYRDNVDRKLIIRQRIFFVIITILLGFGGMNIIQGKISFLLGFSGLVGSTLVGLSLSRMFLIFWHVEKAKVVSQLDALGTVLLILYIGIEVGRKWIFQHWLAGVELNAFGLMVLTGLLLGRFLGTVFQIKKALVERK